MPMPPAARAGRAKPPPRVSVRILAIIGGAFHRKHSVAFLAWPAARSTASRAGAQATSRYQLQMIFAAKTGYAQFPAASTTAQKLIAIFPARRNTPQEEEASL